MFILVYENFNLARFAERNGCLDYLGQIFKLAEACLTQNRFGSGGLDLLGNFGGGTLATVGDEIDNDIRSLLSQVESNSCTDSSFLACVD